MATEADSVAPTQVIREVKPRLFGRTKSIHDVLGGGQLADILLWRQWQTSAIILGVASISWILFEWSGYTLLSLLATVSVLFLVIVFIWAQIAPLLKMPPPNLPDFHLREEHVQWIATVLRKHVNSALTVAHDIALGGNYYTFGQVVIGLWVLVYVGAWYNTLNMVFSVVLLSFTLPILYEKFEDKIEEVLGHAAKKTQVTVGAAQLKVKEGYSKLLDKIYKKKTQ